MRIISVIVGLIIAIKLSLIVQT